MQLTSPPAGPSPSRSTPVDTHVPAENVREWLLLPVVLTTALKRWYAYQRWYGGGKDHWP
eukprot:356345-Chlamydomonas_euryale.AAC.3